MAAGSISAPPRAGAAAISGSTRRASANSPTRCAAGRDRVTRTCLIAAGSVAAVLAAAPAVAHQTPEASNMALVGYSDLQARSAYQPLVHQQGGRWIAYIGHHGGIPEAEKPINPLTGQAEFNGTSLVDVTDPAHPNYLAHIPGESGNYEAGGAQMVRVCDGKSLAKGDPDAA